MNTKQTRYFALVDCNNFYASCERVFNPKAEGKPVVVLSNNDGCVIARSNEAKAIGIPMGEPVFKVKQLIKSYEVQVFSSNFSLYGDMSRRVMSILTDHCIDIEIYSIDEAFLELRFYGQTHLTLDTWATQLRGTIVRSTGIPVSIGIGATKTLAKLANHIAKRHTTAGVYHLLTADPFLHKLSISKIWGVGAAYVRRLNAVNVETVADLQQVQESWMQQEFGIVGRRLLKELQAYPCLELDPPVSGRKHTMVSRSFAHDVYELAEVQRRLALYATRLGEKLRKYKQAATSLTIYLWVNKYKNKRSDGRVTFGRSVVLPMATNNTNQLIKWSKIISESLFEAGSNYKKAGIMGHDLIPEDILQGNLFVDQSKEERSSQVMSAVDEINKRLGRNLVYFAACGNRPSIPLRQEYKSPAFTTKWSDLVWVG